MIEFKEENIKYMALEPPDEINFYKYSGDFDGELSAIERYMKRDISDGLKVRLELEAVIAERMTHDYLYDFDGLLERIRKKYPLAEINIVPTRGICSYYAEKGGLMIAFEDRNAK